MKLGYFFVGVIALLYVFAFYIDYLFPAPITLEDLELDEYFLIIDEGTNPGAPVVVVEFLDYQCSYCIDMHSTIKKILAEYDDKINYVVRHIPSDARPYALKSAEAAECAKDQGRFLAYHDLLLGKGVSSFDDLYDYGRKLDLGDEFVTCLQSGNKFSVIQEHVTEAAIHNVKGTPTFFVNGKKLVGGQDYYTLRTLIEAILQNA